MLYMVWEGRSRLYSATALVSNKGNGIHDIELGAALDQFVLLSWKWIRPK